VGSIGFKSLGEFYALLVELSTNEMGLRTPHLLKALAMQLADGVVPLLQLLQATRQRVGDLSAIVFVVGAQFPVLQRSFHLPDGPDQAMRLLGHFMFLVGDVLQLAVQRIR
jgi:hypothetical protein